MHTSPHRSLFPALFQNITFGMVLTAIFGLIGCIVRKLACAEAGFKNKGREHREKESAFVVCPRKPQGIF